MGMDDVMLVMDVERHFGITLRQAEFRKVERVRNLVAIIENRIRVLQGPTWLSLRAFNLLRRVVRDVVGDANFRIRPSESVKARLTPAQRRALWRQFALDKLGLKPPPLELPWLFGRIVQGVYLRLVLMTLWLSFTVTGHYFIIGLVGIPIIAMVTNPLINLFREMPPAGWQTFGCISQKILRLITVTKQTHLRTADAILAELRPILVDVIGCQPELVTLHAHLVEDLGLSC
jgi:hypothetical protein